MANDTKLLAVLIDADNISAKHAEAMFEEIASLGEASIRRIYGDFAGGGPQGWTKEKLAALAIVPHQQFAYTIGNNASYITLLIDAMDILHSGRFDGFVLISSDSDFTRLASRIREQGLDVFFTIDAGPQVKAVCRAADADAVRDALRSIEGVVDVMWSGLGAGARLLGPDVASIGE